jgi:hypothetical protein
MMRSLVVGTRLPLPVDENVTEADWVQSNNAVSDLTHRVCTMTIICCDMSKGAAGQASRRSTCICKAFYLIALML